MGLITMLRKRRLAAELQPDEEVVAGPAVVIRSEVLRGRINVRDSGIVVLTKRRLIYLGRLEIIKTRVSIDLRHIVETKVVKSWGTVSLIVDAGNVREDFTSPLFRGKQLSTFIAAVESSLNESR
jgi:hypothetical protein